jgi:putative phosphoribosyl transferase
MTTAIEETAVRIPVEAVSLGADLALPEQPQGLVLFAHGSGSSRHSRRNRFVAGVLQQAGLATLLMDLLTTEEERADAQTAALRFNIEMLAARLAAATRWAARQRKVGELPLGYFGASTGAGAALVAAAELQQRIGAVVSRGGRPDLAGEALTRVQAPTLLIVGGNDGPVIRLNERALSDLRCEKELVIVPGATHLFEEPGALETVARLATEWFTTHLRQPASASSGLTPRIG